jgi:hypothetical protein
MAVRPELPPPPAHTMCGTLKTGGNLACQLCNRRLYSPGADLATATVGTHGRSGI